jgi:hypothetical protein
MEQRRWFDSSQPQTLQIACFLLYFRAFMLALFGGILDPVGLVFIAAGVGGAYGIANEKKWGYGLAVGVALLPLVLRLVVADDIAEALTIDVALLLQVALVALLLHPQSRDYQRIWFK